MFSAGDAYERFMGRWSRTLAPLLVHFAGVRDGEAILDVGCGTGALSAAVAAAATASRVSGIDSSGPYVDIAAARHGSDRVQFQIADARQIPFPDRTFDRTLSLLILNFVPEPEIALKEMIRVTQPGGTIAAAVWDYGEGMEMLRAFWDEVIALHPQMDAKDERHMRFSADGELSAFWRDHGVRDVVDAGLTIDLRFESFDDYWEPFLAKQGPAGAFVAALSDTGREQLRERLRQRLLGRRADGRILLRARAWAVRGNKP